MFCKTKKVEFEFKTKKRAEESALKERFIRFFLLFLQIDFLAIVQFQIQRTPRYKYLTWVLF